jgi:ubiquitin C-terminal hydrolase
LSGDIASLGCLDAGHFVPAVAQSRAKILASFGGDHQQCVGEAFAALIDKCSAIDLRVFEELAVSHNVASKYTVPGGVIFGGLCSSRVACSVCSRTAVKYEHFNHLSLPIPPGERPTLDAALGLYLHPETLDADFVCPLCRSVGTSTKTVDVRRWPTVLAVHFKRRGKNESGRDFKDTRHIWFQRSISSSAYQLRSVIVHLGRSPSGGHYNCYVDIGNQFYHCDDGSPPVRAEDATVFASQASLLIYENM